MKPFKTARTDGYAKPSIPCSFNLFDSVNSFNLILASLLLMADTSAPAQKFRTDINSALLYYQARLLAPAPLSGWRVSIPALTSAIVVLALVLILKPRANPTGSGPSAAHVGATASPPADLAPTLSNYHMLASESPDKLDELLSRQANRPAPSGTIYTASAIVSAGGPD
jgi:hypothetical protein